MFIALNKDIKGLEWRSNFFAPYITSLPKTCQTLTCSTNTTARLASHTYAFERALEGKRKNLLSYLSASGLSDVISEGDYLVAVSVVESRAWPPGLLPGIDLLNHHEKGNAIEFNLDEKENVAKSFQRVEVGGEGEFCCVAREGAIVCCLVLSCLVLSCLALSCLALPCLALSCLVLPCLVLPCHPLTSFQTSF